MTEKAPKQFKKAPVAALVKYMERAKLEKAEAAEQLFVTPSAVHGWVTAGEMPAHIELAIQTLESRLGGRPRGRMYVATVAPDRVEAFEAFCKTLGIDIPRVKIPD